MRDKRTRGVPGWGVIAPQWPKMPFKVWDAEAMAKIIRLYMNPRTVATWQGMVPLA
jgi:hypothetical protein